MTTVVSFYTNDWDYPKYAKQLQVDCDRFGLEHHIVELTSQDDYVKNCNMKPFFIRDMLHKFQSPVFWIDADGTINSKPELLLTKTIKNFDIAANRSRQDSSRIHVGSIWFNYTPTVIELVEAWCDTIVKRGIDDAVFNKIWANFFDKITFYELPSSYFTILEKPKSTIPPESCIVHRLSSSELKWRYKNKVEGRA
jgi:hypothetical protein